MQNLALGLVGHLCKSSPPGITGTAVRILQNSKNWEIPTSIFEYLNSKKPGKPCLESVDHPSEISVP